MSEKETSQKESSQGIVTRYDKKMQKRREQELKAQREKKISRIVGIAVLVVIVAALVSIPVKQYIAKHSTYITVGGHDITKVEFDYYYNVASAEYINTYGTYLSYMGLNTSGDFASQAYSTEMSWKDYFEQLAVDSIRQNKALLDAAKAAGFTHDATAEYENFTQALKDAAAEAGMSLSKYYKTTFGAYATASQLKPYIEEGYVASAYYQSVADSKEPTEAEIKAYYDENTANYDSVDYKLTEIAAEVPEAQTVTDADGKETTVEPTRGTDPVGEWIRRRSRQMPLWRRSQTRARQRPACCRALFPPSTENGCLMMRDRKVTRLSLKIRITTSIMYCSLTRDIWMRHCQPA